VSTAGLPAAPGAPAHVPYASRAEQMPWFDRLDPFLVAGAWRPALSWHPAMRPEYDWLWHPRGPRRVRRLVPAVREPDGRAFYVPGGRVERIAAALAAWGVLTSQQIGAFTSLDKPRVSRTLRTMHAAGLVERTRVTLGLHYGVRVPYLWRLRETGEQFATWLGRLDEHARWRITFGQPASPSAHERHDVLAAELALRWAEVTERCQGVLGERMAGAMQVLPTHPAVRSRGDAVLVRDDGLRVVVELTAQPKHKAVGAKMRAWARMLAGAGGVLRSGVVVVFVAASYERYRAGTAVLERQLAGALGSIGDPAERRLARTSLFVADWRDWFPAPWVISPRFVALEARWHTGSQVAVLELGRSDGGEGCLPPLSPRWEHLRAVRRELPAVPRWVEGPLRQVIDPAPAPGGRPGW